MNWKRVGLLALIGSLGLGTAACTDGYGYGGASLGYGSGYYADPYYGGGAFGAGPFGWYNDFYYPGTGVYVYDRQRRPYRWNSGQRRYWQGRPGWNRQGVRPNWNSFHGGVSGERPGYRWDGRGPQRDGIGRGGTGRGEIRRGEIRRGDGDIRRDDRRSGREMRQGRGVGRPDGFRGPRNGNTRPRHNSQ